MNPIRKTFASLAAVLLLILFFILNNCHSVYALANGKLSADSIVNALKERQVLLSQQLFVVKLSKAKKTAPKKVNVDFKAELRDAFMIVCYENGKSYTELNWAMCPNGACPISGTFKSGTPQYKQLDLLIAQIKQANAKSQKELEALRTEGKKH
jgi:hypothetical protein